MTVFCGIDWAEKHHDVAMVDAHGQLVAKRRIADSVDGYAELIALLAEAGDSQSDPIRQDPLVEEAMGVQALRLLATLDTECASVDALGQAVTDAFARHPDYEIMTSFIGVGDITGACLLAEIGDDRTRFGDARALKAYAGAAPITRASGRSASVTHRPVKNDRLATAGYIWAFTAATHSPGARTHYRRRRDHGDRHPAALRNLFNRLLGCLYHCLQTGQTYDEATAFPTSTEQAQTPAA